MAPRTHSRPRVILLLACIAQFMVVLDVAVVNVALPTIQKDLRIVSQISIATASLPVPVTKTNPCSSSRIEGGCNLALMAPEWRYA
jgi:MFS family permease